MSSSHILSQFTKKKANVTLPGIPLGTYSKISSGDSKVARRRSWHEWKSCLEGFYTDWWYWEILTAVLSLVTFCAICMVLYNFDCRPSPTLPYALPLSSLVSFLATISKSFLFVAIASSTDQFKWLWFSGKNRRLEDMQVYDEASRGPWGSLMLLISTRGW